MKAEWLEPQQQTDKMEDRHESRVVGTPAANRPDSSVLEEVARWRKVSGDGTTMASSDETSAQYSTCCLPSYRLPPVPVR